MAPSTSTYKEFKEIKKKHFPKKLKCDVCNKEFSSLTTSFNHDQGKKHKKKMRKFMKDEKVLKKKEKGQKKEEEVQMAEKDGRYGIGKEFLKNT